MITIEHEGMHVPAQCPHCSASVTDVHRHFSTEGSHDVPSITVKYRCGAALSASRAVDDPAIGMTVVAGCKAVLGNWGA